MCRKPCGEPFLLLAFRIFDEALFHCLPDNRLKLCTRHDCIGDAGIKDFPIAAVAQNKPVLRIVKGEALGDALDCIDESLARFGNLAQVFLDLDRSVTEQQKRLGHAADLVAARGRQWCPKIAAGDGKHALAQPRQAGKKIAVDIQPDDQN